MHGSAEPFDELEVRTLAQWREWMVRHSPASSGVWLTTFKAGLPGHVPYPDILKEAVRLGWYDELAKPVDRARSAHLYRPRRPHLPWSPRERLLVEQLEAAGDSTPQLAAVAMEARVDGSWTAFDRARLRLVPVDLIVALQGAPELQGIFDRLEPKLRNRLVAWLTQVRRPDTRSSRLRAVISQIGAVAEDFQQPWWLAAAQVPTTAHPAVFMTSTTTALLRAYETAHTSRGALITRVASGLGKSFAASILASRHPGAICIVRIEKLQPSRTQALRAVLSALRKMAPEYPHSGDVGSAKGLEINISAVLSEIAGVGQRPIRSAAHLPPPKARLVTVIVEDAQILSSDAFTALIELGRSERSLCRFRPAMILLGNTDIDPLAHRSLIAARTVQELVLTQLDMAEEDLGAWLDWVGASATTRAVAGNEWQAGRISSWRRLQDLMDGRH